MIKKLIIFMSLNLVGLSAMAAGPRVPLPEETLAVEVLGMMSTSPVGGFKPEHGFSPVSSFKLPAETAPPSSGLASGARVEKVKNGVGHAGKFAFKNSPKMDPVERMVQAACELDGSPCTDTRKNELRQALKVADFKRLKRGEKALMCSYPGCAVIRQGERNMRSHFLANHCGVRWINPKNGKLTISSDCLW